MRTALSLFVWNCRRLAIQELLCQFFRGVISQCPDDLLTCVYLCCNKLAPAYVGLELGIGDSLLIKALSEASGQPCEPVVRVAAPTHVWVHRDCLVCALPEYRCKVAAANV